jgi:hypothetical protein
MDEIGDTVWRRLAQAADDPADPLRLFTLATVTPENRAAARLMTLRGADRRLGRIWCHSKSDSPKIADLRLNPWFAAVAYDPVQSVQIRLEGSAEIHELDPLARSHFEQASRARESADLVEGEVPDLLWPGSPAELQHAITRGAWRHFAVIQMEIDSIVWTQVVGAETVHCILHPANGWKARKPATERFAR